MKRTLRCVINYPLKNYFSTVRDSYMLNVEFEGIGVRDLADPSLHNWAHHVQYILPQVRKHPHRFTIKCIHVAFFAGLLKRGQGSFRTRITKFVCLCTKTCDKIYLYHIFSLAIANMPTQRKHNFDR